MPPPGFEALGLSSELSRILHRGGISEPFPIQSAVIPDALAGRDICGRAPTGSGKTLAFGLPLVTRLEKASHRRPTGLILAPTRELAEQIAGELRPFAEALGHKVCAIYGGVGFGPQRRQLDAGAALVVACPGRLEDLLSQGALRLDDVRIAVVDEADRMADMGFLPAVRRILGATPDGRQTMLFSATLEGPVAKITREFQQDPARHEIGSSEPDLSNVDHLFWRVDRADRTEVTAQFISHVGPTVVFCRTRHGADRLVRQLKKHGVSGAPIHGSRSQGQRDRALKAFSAGSVDALIATDVAARGIHVDHVAAVVHFDPPADAATYVHRSGRTARAGATGVVLSVIEPSGSRDAGKLQRQVGIDVGIHLPDLDTVTAAAPTQRRRAASRDVSDTARPEGRSPRSERTPRPERPASQRERSADARPKRDRSTNRTPAKRHDDRHGESGTVKYFSAAKGYGFIARPGADDLFVHFSNIEGNGFRSLEKGGQVRFEVGPGKRGPEARNVRAI